MRPLFVVRLVTVFVFLAQCSCSSVVNTFRERGYWHDSREKCASQIYGGTCLNLSIIRAKSDPIGLAKFLVPAALIDLPLSLVADTVLLPVNIPQKIFDLNRVERPTTYDPCAPFSNSKTACVQHSGCGVTNVDRNYPELFSCALIHPEEPPIVNYNIQYPSPSPASSTEGQK